MGTLIGDIYTSFQSPAFWLWRQGRSWLVYNPNVFVEGSITAEGIVQMGVAELIFKLKFVGFKFTPLDFTLAVDMEIPKQREKESQVIG